MILTVLEARVSQERVADLQAGYDSLARRMLPPGLVSSQLVRDAADAERWRLETVWRDREALESVRSKGTPAGMVLFREVGTEPTLAVFEVVATISASGH